MTNFKIVPVEPVEEMLRVACDEEQRPLPMWTRMKAIYTATLAEAPVINIVATKNKQGQIVSVTLQDEDHRILEVIAESDVQGEHEDDSAAVRMDKQRREDVAAALGFIRGGNYAWSYLLQQIKDITSAAEAPQPAEPDEERLAMEAVMKSVDPATWPGLTTAQRCALGRFAKPQPTEQHLKVLAKGYFHPLDENDYEFHAEENFPDGNDCPDCVPAVIVRKGAVVFQPAPYVADYEQALEDQMRLTRELDVLLNGEEGAAQQASLADLVAQLRTVVKDTGKPILASPDVSELVK